MTHTQMTGALLLLFVPGIAIAQRGGAQRGGAQGGGPDRSGARTAAPPRRGAPGTVTQGRRYPLPPAGRAPLSGMVSPRAIGRPAPVATPIGGLATRPLGSQPVGDGSRSRYQDGPQRRRSVLYPYRNGYYPLSVADAPLLRGGGVQVYLRSDIERERVDVYSSSRRWYATLDKPRWRVDSSVTPVQAWRDLIVSDVLCDGDGICIEREQRVRAPWVSVCRCYLLTDALGRRWEVE